jgi:chemotaxis protein CheX
VNVDYINPFISSAVSVFSTVLSCDLKRTGLSIKQHLQPDYEVSGIIGLAGQASGTVVLSLSREVALSATEAMLGERPPEMNADVVDAIGELTNMIAGASKAKLEQFDMRLSLPTVIIGQNHTIQFASTSPSPLSIVFDSRWGKLCLDVSLVEHRREADGQPHEKAAVSRCAV